MKIKNLITKSKRYARIRKLSRILDRITLSGAQSGTIVIGNIRNNIFYIAFDYTLAFFLSKLGFRVYILVDDGQLAHHDTRRISQATIANSLSQGTSKKPIKMGGRRGWMGAVYRHYRSALKKQINKMVPLLDPGPRWIKNRESNIVFVHYSEIIKAKSDDDDQLETRHRQMRSGSISKHVDASHRRYFGGRNFDPANDLHVEYAKLSIKNDFINEQIADYLLREINPDLYITLDGIYSTFGPLVDAMKAHNVPVLIYQPDGFNDRAIRIGREHAAISSGGDHWKDFVASHYTSAVQSEARAFMDNRLQLDSDAGRAVDERWINLLKDEKQTYRKVVAMFPNLGWDGAIRERDTVFDGLGAWLKETVEWVKDKDILLVIREHPQPKHLYDTFESSLALLKELLPDADSYDNVILIKGTEPVSSYQLIKAVIDCSIVYNGTLGVEIPYMGEPVIIAANSPYSHKGVGYEPTSKEEYFDYILNVSRDSEEFKRRRGVIQENALRAAAYQFVYNTYYCPLMPTLEAFHSDNRYWQSWDLDLDSLDPNRNLRWKRTIKRFVEPLVKAEKR